ncbi:MAG: hypothetical protein JST81_06615 [Bacteroidetes bacterium]|nr:hypothetical protein [Bacteroidota bacterium]
MKLLSSIIFIVFPFAGYCQFDSTAWLPEKYVHAVLSGENNSSVYSIPIEGFEGTVDDPYVMTYKSGESKSLTIKKINTKHTIKYRLDHLEYRINLMYNTKQFYEEIAKSIFYISKVGDKLLLEIHKDGITKKVYFINLINGHRFSGIRQAKEYLQSK